MGFDIVNVSNKSFGVKNPIGVQQFQRYVFDTMAPNEEKIVFETDRPVVIDFLEWGTRNEDDGIIYIISGVNAFNTLDSALTGSTNYFSPKIIRDGYSPIWDIVTYDPTFPAAPLFRFNFKREMYFPTGIKIVLKNISTDLSFRNSVAFAGRFMG